MNHGKSRYYTLFDYFNNKLLNLCPVKWWMATLRIYIYKNTNKYLLGKWITLVGVPTHDVGGSNLGKEEDKREWRIDLENHGKSRYYTLFDYFNNKLFNLCLVKWWMATLRIYIYKNTDKYLLGKWITLVGVPTHDVGGSNLGWPPFVFIFIKTLTNIY